MNIKIVPAILESDVVSTRRIIQRLSKLNAGLHLDVLDGTLFSTEKNLLPEDLRRLKLPRPTTLHIMVKRPEAWLRAAYAARIHRVIIHAEADLSSALLKELRKHFQIILGLAPQTPLLQVQNVGNLIEGFQVMTVHPGRQGGVLIPKQLEVIRALRRRWPRKLIIADGGMNASTIRSAVLAGANEIVVGSALTRSHNPSSTFNELHRYFD